MIKEPSFIQVFCAVFAVAFACFGAERPANDDWSAATTIAGFSATWTATNTAATREPGEPSPSGSTAGGSVWYRWSAPTSGVLAISFYPPTVYHPTTSTNLPSEFDPGGSHGNDFGVDIITFETEARFPFIPSIAAFTGDSVSNLTLAASGTNLFFRVTAGAVYSIAIDGLNGSSGTTNVFLHLTPPPPNDHFANAITLGGGHVQFTGYDVSATAEPGALSGGNSVWWRWTAPSTGIATWTGSASLTNPVLRVLSGSQSADLRLQTTLAGSSETRVQFIARTGRSYWLQTTSPGLGAGALTNDLVMSVMQPFLENPRAGTANGSLDFKIVGTPGTRALIQQSIDLRTWTSFGSVWMFSDEWNTRVYFPTNQPTLFYRSILVP